MEQPAFNPAHLSTIIFFLMISTNLHKALSFQESSNSTEDYDPPLDESSENIDSDEESLFVCDPLKGKKQCSLDCRTLLFCSGTEVLGTILCPNNLPNCNPFTGSCVSGQVQGCILKDSFLCPSAVGYFPHPTDCTLYNYCSEHGVVQSYWCRAGSVFDMHESKCVKGGKCGFIDCSKGKPFAYHTVYREMYALCEDEEMIPGSYEECTKASHFFDYDQFACVAVCQNAGNIPHEYDNTKYYRCKKVGTNFTKKLIDCPVEYKFNENSKICKPSTDVSPLRRMINSVLPVLPELCCFGLFS